MASGALYVHAADIRATPGFSDGYPLTITTTNDAGGKIDIIIFLGARSPLLTHAIAAAINDAIKAYKTAEVASIDGVNAA